MSAPAGWAIRRIDAGYPRLDEVLALLKAAFAYMDGRIDPPSSVHRLTLEAIRRQAADGAVFVAEADDAVVGCLFAEVRGEALYLGKLAVDPGSRGRGLARALIARAAEEARKRGLPALELQTRIELTGNHAAFARLGFSKVAETAHPGFDRPTSVTMRRRI